MNLTKSLIKPILQANSKDWVSEYKFCQTRRWKFDFANPLIKVAIEYEGIFSNKSRHTTITGYVGDCEKYNTAALLGWRVLRYTAKNINNLIIDLEKLNAE